MLEIKRVVHEDDYVGTVRRTIKRAIAKQLTGSSRQVAMAAARSIKGGVIVHKAPAGATVLRHAAGGWIIPVDANDKLVRV